MWIITYLGLCVGGACDECGVSGEGLRFFNWTHSGHPDDYVLCEKCSQARLRRKRQQKNEEAEP